MKSQLSVLLLVIVLILVATVPSAAAPTVRPCAADTSYDPACDMDQNGVIDVMDIQLAAGHWGQTGTYSADAAPPCFDNANRYVDCGNGTVTDTVTGLIWLKDASCLGSGYYVAANNAAAGLQTGVCGLTDNSSPGDWRLPTKTEWEETMARAVVLGCTYANAPSLTNTPGTDCYNSGPQQFTGVQSLAYWSSTTYDMNPEIAWYADMFHGAVVGMFKESNYTWSVWPVRGG